MDRMLYVAMSSARQTLQAQALVSHNLSNVNTVGFRQDLSDFRSMAVFSDHGLPTRVYSMAERPGIDLKPGKLMSTGRDLDVAIQGEGWMAIQAPDGTEAYTRAGNFQMDANGLLTTETGYQVMGTGGAITIPPAEKISIGADGAISIRPLGESAANLVEVGRIRLIKPTDANPLYKDEGGFMRTLDGSAAPPDASVRLVSGTLEGSNVNPTEALVSMIQSARSYEMQIKMMKTAEENSTATNQLLRLE